jgi:hypothetical protein
MVTASHHQSLLSGLLIIASFPFHELEVRILEAMMGKDGMIRAAVGGSLKRRAFEG